MKSTYYISYWYWVKDAEGQNITNGIGETFLKFPLQRIDSPQAIAEAKQLIEKDVLEKGGYENTVKCTTALACIYLLSSEIPPK